MKRVFTVMATVATAAGTVLVVAPPSSAQDCSSEIESAHGHYNTNDLADRLECDDEGNLATGTFNSMPASGTGGLILRDENGNDLGSGIGEGQLFEFIECGSPGSGLIKVNQITRGSGGGWGELYDGFVKVEWTKLPEQFSFCD